MAESRLTVSYRRADMVNYRRADICVSSQMTVAVASSISISLQISTNYHLLFFYPDIADLKKK